MKRERIVVIGGGAAGFFAAIRAAECFPLAEVIILEKTSKLLSKVKVSGGGRCNVTHHCFQNNVLAKSYPRGEKGLKKSFSIFSTADTIEWFEKRGVKLKVEPDGRMFPITDNSQTIIDCFLKEVEKRNIKVFTNHQVLSVKKKNDIEFLLEVKGCNSLIANGLIVAIGGSAKPDAYHFLEGLGHTILSPIPSLFTFNTPNSETKKLAGISMPSSSVRVVGTKFEYEGPVLITHWGFSGPAVLKLSAYGAKWIHDQQYQFQIQVRWIEEKSEEKLREHLQVYKEVHPKQTIVKHPLFNVPSRLWELLCDKAQINQGQRWLDISKKNFNKLVEALYRDQYDVKGKTTFKEEFVTCGGVSLNEVDMKTMESKVCPGVFFAGEVLDIDGITGGFNFQSAWTTAYIAGSNILQKS